MLRKARIEFPGAVYQVLDRGDRREAIFIDGVRSGAFSRPRRALTRMRAGKEKSWNRLIFGLLTAGLGILTIVTGRFRRTSIQELNPTGTSARFVGIILLIIAVILLADWVRIQKRN